MKLARFNVDRLGVVDPGTDTLADISALIAELPATTWAKAPGDPVIARLPAILAQIPAILPAAPRIPLSSVTLETPVATPSKIIGAPVNYHAHLDEAEADAGLHHGQRIAKIDEIGCFLKATSALFGPGAQMELPFADRRVDPDGEIAVIVGFSTPQYLARCYRDSFGMSPSEERKSSLPYAELTPHGEGQS